MTKTSTRPDWTRWLEYGLYAVLAGVFLYRCVLPVPGGSIGPAAETLRVPVGGVPTMVEFSASR